MQHARRTFMRLGLQAGVFCAAGWPGPTMASAYDPDSCRAAARKIRDLYEKKKEPGLGDWLATQKEDGQTFDRYLVTESLKRRTDTYSKIYVQPIGNFTEQEQKAVATLHEFMNLFFGLEVKLLPKIDLQNVPEGAQRASRGFGFSQILTTYILNTVLRPNRPKDAVAVMAITAYDLWPGEGWNFVFGQAMLQQRVGVWSTCRFGDPDKDAAKYLRRVLQVAVHEAGHMFGIEHCIAYQCGMNGSNNLDESDRTPIYWCPECDPKLWWACKLDPAKRAAKLAEFAKAHSLAEEAAMWEKVANRLGE